MENPAHITGFGSKTLLKYSGLISKPLIILVLVSFFKFLTLIAWLYCKNGSQTGADARRCPNAAWDASDTCNIAGGCPWTVPKARTWSSQHTSDDIRKTSWAEALYRSHDVRKSVVVSIKTLLHSRSYSIYGQRHCASVLIQRCSDGRQRGTLDGPPGGTRGSARNVPWIWAHVHRLICAIGRQKRCPR